MFNKTPSKNSSLSSLPKRKRPGIIFLSLSLAALLVLMGFPALALASDPNDPTSSFDISDTIESDTDSQGEEIEKDISEKDVATQDLETRESEAVELEAPGALGLAAPQDIASENADANTPRATTEVFIFRIVISNPGEDFFIPTSGGGSGRSYDWQVYWGDTTWQYADGVGSSTGIKHTYSSPGIYRIIIYPRGSHTAWLTAFGFSPTDDQGANAQANRDRVFDVESPLTPSMTRDPNGSTVPDNEWSYTFNGCRNLTMGEDFTFSDEWDSITAVGDNFACNMFSGCEAFTMNSVFSLPKNLTSVGDNFAINMFSGCGGNAFTMGDAFNLPQNLTNVGSSFASNMFESCSGGAFAMNSVFNLPQGLTSVGDSFASNMFSQAGGPSFQVNGAFKFPQFDDSTLNQTGMFEGTFQNLASSTPKQLRLAQSIIGDPSYVPNTARSTFTGAHCFSDLPYIAINWGGDGLPAPSPTPVPHPDAPSQQTLAQTGDTGMLVELVLAGMAAVSCVLAAYAALAARRRIARPRQ